MVWIRWSLKSLLGQGISTATCVKDKFSYFSVLSLIIVSFWLLIKEYLKFESIFFPFLLVIWLDKMCVAVLLFYFNDFKNPIIGVLWKRSFHKWWIAIKNPLTKLQEKQKCIWSLQTWNWLHYDYYSKGRKINKLI